MKIIKDAFTAITLLFTIVFYHHTVLANDVSKYFPRYSHIEFLSGYSIPNDSDLKSSWATGVGYRFRKADETVFCEVIYSPAQSKLTYPMWSGNAEQYYTQFGILKAINNSDKMRIGAGFQIEKVRFTNIKDMTRTTITGVVEHDLSNSTVLRLQYSPTVKNDNIRFGSKLLFLVIYKIKL